MLKPRIVTIAVFVVTIITCSMFLSSVQASRVMVTWGEANGVLSSAERAADYATTSYIANLVDQGYAGPNWYAANYYGGMTTASNVYDSNYYVKIDPSYDYLSTFHVGDMYPNFLPHSHLEQGEYWDENYQCWMTYFYYVVDGYTRHYTYYANGVGDVGGYPGIEDDILYTKTSWKNQFTFIWTCVNADWIHESMQKNRFGELVPGSIIDNYYFYDSHGTGLVGMPAAWTHDFDMEPDGYANPDTGNMCYIGFENTSLGLCDNSEFITSNYGEFVRDFYYYALVEHQSIRYSLNLAMSGNGVSNFGVSWLNQGYWDNNGYFCKMRVYGNSNNILPY
jgi:hypothetical protein